jgi:phage terminase large subunit-like protein
MSNYYFDEGMAARAAAFFPRFLRLTEGEWAGKPFELSPHQDHHIRQIFGWRRKSDGLRRYRRVRWWEPRKNGKTELAAGVGFLLLLGDGEPGAQIFSHATDKSQASISFERATKMVAFSPALAELIEPNKEGLYVPATMSVWRALSGIPKGKHGLNPHGLIGDEAHEWGDSKLHTFLRQGMGARRQPLDFIISTAGERSGYGWDLYNLSTKIRDGLFDDPESYVVICEASPEDDWKDPATWAKANPNLGISLKLSYLQDQIREAQESPRLENDFKRYHLNLWVEQAVRWLPMDHWHKCSALDRTAGKDLWKELEDRLRGRRCYGGLDLASVSDIAAWILWFPPEDGEPGYVLCRFFIPKENIAGRVRQAQVPYDKWVAAGALKATPGNVTDYEAIKLQIEADAEAFIIEKIGIDRWNATHLSNQLTAEGLPVMLYGQGFASLSAPSKELERLVLKHGFEHGHHPVLAWMASNVATEGDAAGNIKPSKSKSTEKIDGIAGQVMAIGLSMGIGTEAEADEQPTEIPDNYAMSV